LEQYYNADSDKELVGGSVSATEHSVMCMGGLDDEIGTFKRLITELYPNGIVSIVSDTWDFWNVITPSGGILTTLKDEIMARDGKVVIRPDSGDPVKIVTGYMPDEYHYIDGVYYKAGKDFGQGRKEILVDQQLTEDEVKGMIVCLWEIFGGTTTSKGYKQLDSHIGAIYGDSITLERATQICERLEAKGFASTNLVYGIGSFTYQGAIDKDAIITRDTHGFAVKSTYGEVLVDGERKGIEIFKDPKTDDGLKKSAKGLIAVYEDADGNFFMKDQATWEEVKNCAFVQVFANGVLTKDWTLQEIRAKVATNF
jgi:nicotinamide phosphoribosyltransferase